MRGEVTVTDATGAVTGTRQLIATGDDCDELVTALALAISIAIDPNVVFRPAPPPAARRPSPLRRAQSPPRALPCRRRSPQRCLRRPSSPIRSLRPWLRRRQPLRSSGTPACPPSCSDTACCDSAFSQACGNAGGGFTLCSYLYYPCGVYAGEILPATDSTADRPVLLRHGRVQRGRGLPDQRALLGPGRMRVAGPRVRFRASRLHCDVNLRVRAGLRRYGLQRELRRGQRPATR